MSFTRAAQLARETPIARPTDNLGLVAQNLRESQYDALPVIEGELDRAGKLQSGARVVGIVFEYDLAAAVLPLLALQEAEREQAAGAAATQFEAATNGSAGQGATAAVAAPPLAAPATPAARNVRKRSPFFAAPWRAAAKHDHSQNGWAGGQHTSSAAAVDATDNSAAANAAAANAAAANATLGAAAELTARDVMHEFVAYVPAGFSLHNALLTLERYNAPALPVVDDGGGYRGMISRADVVAALGGAVRPPTVGGMATPLGVWLTTGRVSGGAPPFGLFLTGMILGIFMVAAHLFLLLGLTACNPIWGRMFLSGRLGALSDSTQFFNVAVTIAEGLIFLLLMRLTPLAGIHAAEHQTVWAIERGVPLEPALVRKMPRAHPRCGTNLMALAALIEIVIGHLPAVNGSTVLLALLVVYLSWRNFGTLLQEVFTTRPASLKQLESGIRAGREVMARYQAQPVVRSGFSTGAFYSGLILSAVGMLLVITVAENALSAWAAQLIFGG